MNTIMPIMIPVSHEDPKCPNCGKKESIKKVCNHCGHEYKHVPLTFSDKIFTSLVVIVILWLIVTVLFWLLDNLTGGGFDREPYSLWEVIKIEWEFITTLKIF